MKTRFFLSALLSFYFCLLSSQVPQGFSYQAIATDAGHPIITPIGVRITIQSDSITSGTIFWVEEYSSITPNESGLFTLVIGTGSRISGTANKFSDIDWSVTPKFIKTEINYGGWKTLGSSRLWSVPFSMIAGDLGGTIDKLRVKGKETSPDSVLFEVKNSNGQTVFAVYSEGVRIYVDDGIAKSAKGGFAIGGFGTDKGVSQKYLIVKPDSIRMYVDDRPGKTAKGGFAIGGFGTGKYPARHLLIVNPDSIRAYIDTTSVGKSAKGGFAIGGFGTAKGPYPKYLSVNPNKSNIVVNDSISGFSVTNVQGGKSADFMRMNKINYFIGHESGLKTVTVGDNGKFNSFIGYQAGHENVDGSRNIFVGYQAGYKNNAAGNIFIGNSSGYNNVAGANNVFVGYSSGKNNTGGQYNTFLGYNSGTFNYDGTSNVYIGYNTGDINFGGYNIYIGSGAGHLSGFPGSPTGTACTNNIYIGFEAGLNNKVGSSNVYIGYQAGRTPTTGSNGLIIANSSAHSLITGTFGTDDASSSVDIKGTLTVKGAVVTPSDLLLKTNLQPVDHSLEKLLNLTGYYFFWKRDVEESGGMSERRQIGLVAQEVEKVFPELVVSTGKYKAIDYTKVVPVLLQAIKEQNEIITGQKAELENIKNEITELKSVVYKIEHVKN